MSGRPGQLGSARMAALAAALLLTSIGLALWPLGRERPSMPMQAGAELPPAPHSTVVRPPADARAQEAASGACVADPAGAADATTRRGT